MAYKTKTQWNAIFYEVIEGEKPNAAGRYSHRQVKWVKPTRAKVEEEYSKTGPAPSNYREYVRWADRVEFLDGLREALHSE